MQIDETYKKGSVYPILLNFRNGYTTEQLTHTHCNLFEDEDNEKITVAELNGVLYAGREQDENLGKTFIVARSKTTGKVRLIEIGSVDVQPALQKDTDASQLLETSYIQLSRKFGSKKLKKTVEQREKLKVSTQTVMEQMKNVTETISEDKLDLSAYNKNDSEDFYVPPINRNATSVEDVYDISKILLEEHYEKILAELEGKDITTSLQPWLKSIVSAKKNLSQKHTVLAVYANALATFYSSNMKDITKKSYVACENSATLNNIILSGFTTTSNGRRCRPLTYRDKALCHILVFTFILNNFKLEIEPLALALKTTPTTLSQKARVTGASIITSGDKKIAQLKLPLSTINTFKRRSAKF